jgi:hypothetical protein
MQHNWWHTYVDLLIAAVHKNMPVLRGVGSKHVQLGWSKQSCECLTENKNGKRLSTKHTAVLL